MQRRGFVPDRAAIAAFGRLSRALSRPDHGAIANDGRHSWPQRLTRGPQALTCPPMDRALLEDQDAGGDERRRVGIALRRLRQMLPVEARGRGHRRDLLHQRRLPAVRRRDLPLRRLCEPAGAGAGLRRADAAECPHHLLAAGHLRLPAGRRGQRPLLVASAGVGRPETACTRPASRCAAGSRHRNRIWPSRRTISTTCSTTSRERRRLCASTSLRQIKLVRMNRR